MDQIKNYDSSRANQYDDESVFDKGNRAVHVSLLKDLLSYKETSPDTFLELGCGTGFFTSVFLERYPDVNAILLDGSSSMLDIAKDKYGTGNNIRYDCAMLEDIDWESIPPLDIVFSALTIHHLSNESKYELYKEIYQKLKPGAKFIYFDQFKTDHAEKDLLLEYLACKDIQNRFLEELSLDFIIADLEIDKIIEKDRNVKASENDKEDLIQNSIKALENIGFGMVATVYQEARFFAVICYK